MPFAGVLGGNGLVPHLGKITYPVFCFMTSISIRIVRQRKENDMEFNRKNMRSLALLIAFGILLLVGLQNFRSVSAVVRQFFALLAPFLLGGCIAFILNVPVTFFERTLLRRKFRARRTVSIVLSLLLVIGLITFAGGLVIPQLGRSIQSIGAAFPQFFKEVQRSVAAIEHKIPLLADWLTSVVGGWDSIDWPKLGQTVWTFVSGTGDIIGSTLGVASSVLSGFVNFFLGMFFAIYVLAQKEKLGRQVKKLLYATLSVPHGDSFLGVCSLAQQTLSNFITGQCTEACILGLMFFLSMSLLHFPYAALISVLIGMTALIPIFGTFIGCAFGAFFILIENPMQALWFIILFLVLQQIEGNFIYPHVVGGSVGLPSIWVLVAVSVGGASLGVVGMLIFIPLFSVLYALLRGFTNRRLALRGVPPEKWGDRPAKPAKTPPKDDTQSPKHRK